ncbi:hypothetical protein M434DRAFT_10762 [Hypoxylon sp. CO27-5]|nr:hypothetical protein M434DRAFT_10762 [Hypoxylon sp. CO27-5]
MVSFKKLFFLGAALFSVTNAIPSPTLPDLALVDRSTPLQGAPGKALLENFHQWLLKNAWDYRAAFSVFERATVRGGLYEKAAGAVANDFGFAVFTVTLPSATELQALLKAINAWASQAGGIVQVISRENNFFDPSAIGAGQKRDVEARSRGNACPANTDILKYATLAVSTDININRDIRFAGECNPV